MRKKHFSFLVLLVAVDLLIKVVIELNYSHLFDTKYFISRVISFYPVKSTIGMSLTEIINVEFSSGLARLSLFVVLLVLFSLYMNQFYLCHKHVVTYLTCLPIVLMMASVIVRMITSLYPGYTLDYISVYSRFICDTADIYLWIGGVFTGVIALYFIVVEEKFKSKMKLKTVQSLQYDCQQFVMAVKYYCKLHE